VVTVVDFHKQGRVRPRVSTDGGPLVAKCRVALSRVFGIMDRIRFLFTGRMWVVTINGKASTSVVLTMRRPKE